MIITVKVPNNGKSWALSFGHGLGHKKTCTSVYREIERRLTRKPIKEKLGIRVVYDKEFDNQTLYSTDARYLLFTLACFLEDHLEWKFGFNRMKKYAPIWR